MKQNQNFSKVSASVEVLNSISIKRAETRPQSPIRSGRSRFGHLSRGPRFDRVVYLARSLNQAEQCRPLGSDSIHLYSFRSHLPLVPASSTASTLLLLRAHSLMMSFATLGTLMVRFSALLHAFFISERYAFSCQILIRRRVP